MNIWVVTLAYQTVLSRSSFGCLVSLKRWKMSVDKYMITHPDSSDQLRGFHITQYRCGYCQLIVPLWVLWGYADVTVIEATAHAVAVEYSHSTLNSTLTCSSYIGTLLYETQVASQEESDCVGRSSYIGFFFLFFFFWFLILPGCSFKCYHLFSHEAQGRNVPNSLTVGMGFHCSYVPSGT